MVLRGLFLANLRPSRSLSRSGLGLSSSPSPSLRSPRFHPSLLLSIDALLPFLSFLVVFARTPRFFFSISFLSHTTSFRSFHPFSFLFFSAPLDLATLFRVNPRAGDRFYDSKRHRRRSNVPSPRNISTRRPIVGRHARARYPARYRARCRGRRRRRRRRCHRCHHRRRRRRRRRHLRRITRPREVCYSTVYTDETIATVVRARVRERENEPDQRWKRKASRRRGMCAWEEKEIPEGDFSFI